MTTTITCELGCNKVIAVADTDDEARELAEEAEATYEREAGEWICKECSDAHYREGMAMAEAYERDAQLQAIIRESRDAQDSMLERADSIYDAARDRGEI